MKTNLEIVKGFLEEEFESFQAYLDSIDIEPTEAEVIINSLENEHDSKTSNTTAK